MERLTIEGLKAQHTTIGSIGVSTSPRYAPTFRRQGGVKPASEAQVNFLRELVAERAPDTNEEFITSVIDQGSQRVSAAIGRLKAMPKVETAPTSAPARTNRYAGKCEDCGLTVEAEEGILTKSDSGRWEVAHREGECPASAFPFPNGRYAVENAEGVLRFYVADHEGLFVQASDELHRVHPSGQEAVIEAIAADPETASRRYGTELGRCGRCNRTLTDEVSRAAGLGPVCAAKGW